GGGRHGAAGAGGDRGDPGPAIAAPLVAGIAAMLATRLTYRINRNVTDPNQQKSTAKGYRAGQIASAGLVSLAHGTNDAQKTMGII
ncbi:inorganic phosphate transporter, partial [Streptomyces cavourensis]|nr:inorganic phosphate transporter [Streptomyces cavourensis]